MKRRRRIYFTEARQGRDLGSLAAWGVDVFDWAQLCTGLLVDPSFDLTHGRTRPMSRRQRADMLLLVHIREQHYLPLRSYGRPRMTEELKEMGRDVCHRRVGRLMKQNGIRVVRTQKYKTKLGISKRVTRCEPTINEVYSNDAINPFLFSK